MLTTLGLRGFVMQIYTPGQVAVECDRQREREREEGGGIHTQLTRPEFRSQQLANI